MRESRPPGSIRNPDDDVPADFETQREVYLEVHFTDVFTYNAMLMPERCVPLVRCWVCGNCPATYSKGSPFQNFCSHFKARSHVAVKLGLITSISTPS